MVERDGRLVFGGGSVCFPNRWDLRSKLGLTLDEVHEPVARLNTQLGTPIDRFLDRLGPERSYWRTGWGITDTTDWYTPLDGTAASRPTSPGPMDHVLRVERETFRRFPETNCVVFTLRTYITPLSQLVHDAGAARPLAAEISAVPPDVADYKNVRGVRDDLVAALGAARGGRSSTT